MKHIESKYLSVLQSHYQGLGPVIAWAFNRREEGGQPDLGIELVSLLQGGQQLLEQHAGGILFVKKA